MRKSNHKPALRPVETIVVPDARYGRVLILRDTEGVTDAQAHIPPALIPIVARFTGKLTVEQIAREASNDTGSEIPVEIVERLAEELDRGLFLDSASYRAARAAVEKAFVDAAVRPASHAGGAYLADGSLLARYLDEKCLAKAHPTAPPRPAGTKLVALVAPHIDPWRGAVGYGHAYGAMAASLAPEVDTFVLFGTSHVPMREPFALCNKAFDTPLGALPADSAGLDAIARACSFDAYAGQFNHKREHSLEFQVVFLRHLLGKRPARVIPILAGLGDQQSRKTDPARSRHASELLDAVRELVESRPGRVVVVAGADMAHVGPRFGDAQAYGDGDRARLADADLASLARASAGEAKAFWDDVVRDLETRRVCGLAPIYALLRTMQTGARGEILHYEQNVDKEDGSIVSHAAVGFFA